MKMEELLKRLDTYPGAHENEIWKSETDLSRCTKREKQEMQRLGFTVEDFQQKGLNRGQVAHVLFGYVNGLEVRALETGYKGCRFRSRLEARWAVFFDALGVKWSYEPIGFELPSGAKYLPDFRIKCLGKRGCTNEPFTLFVEVKGEMTEDDADKIKEFSHSFPVLVVGDIPVPDSYDACSKDLESYDRMNGCDIYPWNYYTIDGDYFAAYPAAIDGQFYLDGDDSSYQTADLAVIRAAFAKARGARFEWGECG